MAVKRAIISAAGRGTRMKHLSADRPKHMIEVNGRPFLFYLLDNLEQAGFEDIIIVIGHKCRHIIDYIAQNKHKNIRLINQFERMGQERYGTAIPLLAARQELDDEEFVAVFGDNLYSVRDLQKFTMSDGLHHIAGIAHENPTNYGVLQIDQENYLQRIVEKPKKDIGSNIINTGLMKFTPEIFSFLDQVQPNPSNGEYYLTDAITRLAELHRVKVKIIEDYWLDFGKPEDVEILSSFLNGKKL